MRAANNFVIRAGNVVLLGALFISTPLHADSNLTLRVMSANITSGSFSSYETPGIDIFQGLKPDVVAIQEFKYNNSTADVQLRALVDTAFGTNFVYYREPFTAGGDIPNGIVSRYPIVDSGSWPDPVVSNRGFAWARIDLPGTNDLYVVSVHLYSSGSEAQRNTEATAIKDHVQTNLPAGAWVIVGGDMNTSSRSEAAIGTFTTFLSDSPIPTDAVSGGDPDTNAGRDNPYDYLLPSFSMTNTLMSVVLPSHTFPKGLVFDSRVYTPLSDVSPVVSGDSGASGMQHMAVVKDFLINAGNTTNAPSITTQPQSQTVSQGSDATFTVVANGTTPLSYQWRRYSTNLAGATGTSYTRTNAQPADGGDYSVVVTNVIGSVTSSVAVLTVNAAPAINTQPQGQTIFVGQSATFTVGASGATPLSYQWRFSGTNIGGATTNSYTRASAQTNDAGSYVVVITNSAGSVTSAVATLTVNEAQTGTLTTLAGWDTFAVSGYGPSPFAPTTNAPNLTITGLTRGAGVTTAGTAAGRGWGGNGFDAASASAAVTAGDFATFSIAANGGYKVSFNALSRYDYRRSSGGPPNGVLQYQIGAGAFTDVTAFSYSSSANGGASLSAVDLSGIGALQNVAASNVVTFRIVNYGASSSGGNWYIFDVASNTAPDFTVQGIISSVSTSNPPAARPALGSLNYAANQLSFSVTGSAGSNYIVQASTNLGASNWVSLLTNASPFTFTDSNAASFPQRFYRAITPQ